MDAELVQDAVYRGLGRAGRAVGHWCEVFRPRGAEAPLEAENLVLRMQAGLSAPGGRFSRPQGHGQVYWEGLFDAAYTRVGDYVRRRETRTGAADGGVWFIAAQQKLHPVLCVQATRVIDLLRPPAPEWPGLAPYGGRDGAERVVLRGWPAAVLPVGSGAGEAGLPEGSSAGRGAAGWTVLLPVLPGDAPKPGDVMRDDLGVVGAVAQADLSGAGWRLRVRRIAS